MMPREMETVLFKTEVCRLYSGGRCARKFCRYAHSEAELRPKPNLTKTRLCHFLSDRGYCRNRDCKFAHDESELRGIPGLASHADDDDAWCGRGPAGGLLRANPQRDGVGRDGIMALASRTGFHTCAPLKSGPLYAHDLQNEVFKRVDQDRFQIDVFGYNAQELVALFYMVPVDELIRAQPVSYND